MKFCLHCGNEIDDNDEVCPYCGKKVSTKSKTQTTTKSTGSYISNDKNDEISSTTRIIIYILSAIFDIPGTVLFILYGIKEFQFHSEYDLSELSEAGINAVRELTGNDLNITLIIVGIVLMILGVIISIAPKIIKSIKR